MLRRSSKCDKFFQFISQGDLIWASKGGGTRTLCCIENTRRPIKLWLSELRSTRCSTTGIPNTAINRGWKVRRELLLTSASYRPNTGHHLVLLISILNHDENVCCNPLWFHPIFLKLVYKIQNPWIKLDQQKDLSTVVKTIYILS